MGDLKKDDGWKGRSWRSGQAIWCGFDHGSIAGSALGKMGLWITSVFLSAHGTGIVMNIPKWLPPVWPVEGIPARLKLEATKTENVLTDGTDDVLLTVSVLDEAGKLLNNSPSVYLKLISDRENFQQGVLFCLRKIVIFV